MRFGDWRGVTLATALVLTAGLGLCTTAHGGLFHKTIPPVCPAVDVNTGGPFNAPPIPYGCYAKDHFGGVAGACGLLRGGLCGLCGLHGCGHGCGDPCGGCGGKGCGLCGGTGHCGNGMGCGDPCGRRGLCGNGLFGGRGRGCGGGLCGSGGGLCSPQSMVAPACKTLPSAQSCSMCGGRGCGLCGGRGLGGKRLCGGRGGCGDPCADPCGNCGGRGCGLCKGTGCGLRDGCCLPCGLGGNLCGLVNGILHPHAGQIEWFVGPGGPVPLTPGYVPYVVPTRSPRDFLAFPPMTPDAP